MLLGPAIIRFVLFCSVCHMFFHCCCFRGFVFWVRLICVFLVKLTFIFVLCCLLCFLILLLCCIVSAICFSLLLKFVLFSLVCVFLVKLTFIHVCFVLFAVFLDFVVILYCVCYMFFIVVVAFVV